jgi:hypothetical protein
LVLFIGVSQLTYPVGSLLGFAEGTLDRDFSFETGGSADMALPMIDLIR